MIEFDWDDANLRKLKRHRVSRQEFEQVLANGTLDLEYDVVNGEERYKSMGATDAGRLLIVVWTLRQGSIRGVTGYNAGASQRRVWEEYR